MNNLQFLCVAPLNGQNVAYFLDRASNTVYAYRVIDMTGQQAAQNPTPINTPMPAPQVFVPIVHSDPVPAVIPAEDMTTHVPATVPRSIMPPGLAAMMRDGNEMGAGSV